MNRANIFHLFRDFNAILFHLFRLLKLKILHLYHFLSIKPLGSIFYRLHPKKEQHMLIVVLIYITVSLDYFFELLGYFFRPAWILFHRGLTLSRCKITAYILNVQIYSFFTIITACCTSSIGFGNIGSSAFCTGKSKVI